MGKVVKFTGPTKGRIDPDIILNEMQGDMDELVVCGWTKAGDFILCTSESEAPRIAWVLQRALHKITAMFEEQDDDE